MEELYDYSRHKYYLAIHLGYDIITCRAVATKKRLSKFERNDKADEANENPKGLQEGVIYVRNTLSELADIYLKSKQQSFDNTALYALLYEEAIDLLQKIPYDCKQELNGMDRVRNIKYGDQRVICTIDYQGTYSVDLKLVSAQYPAFRLAQRKLVPQLLKQAHFVIPFGLKELRLSLIACVKKHCDTTLSSESIDDMLGKLSQEYNGFDDFIKVDKLDRSKFLNGNGDRHQNILKKIQLSYIVLHNSNMRPLDSFIKQSQLYQRPILRISNRLKLGLEKIFGDYLQLYSSYKRKVKKRLPVSPASELPGRAFRDMRKRSTLSSDERIESKLMANIEMDDLFASKDESSGSDSESFTTCHPGYMYFFMITYLHCLNKQKEEKLKSNVRSNWRANNIWHAVSMDKKLLDTVFGSIKKLEKLFFASGILKKDDELGKVKFCTRGEEILPAIQNKYQDLDFRLKSYFVVVQISSKHIQLSLHQVVKLASPGEDPASIIIQDEVIQIDDVYDTLCKSIMKSIQVNCQVDYCTTHKSQEDMQCDFQSSKIYSNIYRNLKPCVVELFEKNKSDLDMDSKIQLNINTKCGCSINIFLRDIIEVGLMSVIGSMATNIVASLTNKNLFGNYAPNYIFVFGDPFNLAQGSKIHIAYTMIMQKAIDDGVYIKEKDAKTFVVRESILQLLDTFLSGKKHYMFERFVPGTLCQVSSNTYGMRIASTFNFIPFTRINSDGVIKNTIAEDGSYLVFIQEGKPVSTKGVIIQTNEVKHINLEIIRLESSPSTVPDKYALLHSNTPGDKFKIHSSYLTYGFLNTAVVEYEQISNNLSIKVSRGCMGDINDYIGKRYYKTENFMEPLTLAYI
ncbi:hypothetical protein INT47_012749 [Mucor saturninus]|uniref:Uncharacterized protein n=1 Tax=Mucor saturninus TaxID=64648 RepID=A0A8H7URI9_9FUNG|nr:hypothetical protein INT47_012749 [Mucor saturninus]